MVAQFGVVLLLPDLVLSFNCPLAIENKNLLQATKEILDFQT
jgi:hypothetical protein